MMVLNERIVGVLALKVAEALAERGEVGYQDISGRVDRADREGGGYFLRLDGVPLLEVYPAPSGLWWSVNHV